MLIEINIDKKKYNILSNEFKQITHHEFNNLKIVENLGFFERIISLLSELSFLENNICIFFNSTHGGFIPINCSNYFKKIILSGCDEKHIENIKKNIEIHTTNINNNICFQNKNNLDLDLEDKKKFIVFSENVQDIDFTFIQKYRPILLTTSSYKVMKLYNYHYHLSSSNLVLYIPDNLNNYFIERFHYFIESNDVKDNTSSIDYLLKYDNLINLCIMVKNGGNDFEKMLTSNFHLIDRWTILDTGSTDNTIEIINKVLVGKKKGKLYQESFINFRDSRNRLLEVAGTECKFNLILDDTYIIEGDLITFCNDARSDQYADSFSFYIKSHDVEYCSNRLLKSERKLKYLYKIHEVIQPDNNMNVIIPISQCKINDFNSEYMQNRTMDRKHFDLKLLYEELEDDPNNSRTHYYLGQTYSLLKDYDNAYKFFLERMNHSNEGFLQEKIDAIFEAARLANFKLNKSWSICELLYLSAYELDKSRPDSLYFIGIHYFTENNKEKAFEFFKSAFLIGYPINCQYSLKPTLSFYFLPIYLAPLCYDFKDYILGEKVCLLFLNNNTSDKENYNVILSWYTIFIKLNMMTEPLLLNKYDYVYKKPILCFVADGGFEPWTGSDILIKGIGGSETYIIEMARYIQRSNKFQVIVFCNCIDKSNFEDVEYIPINQFMPFIKIINVKHCIISRFSEFVPVAIEGKTENIYMVLHDILPTGLIIPMPPKLKKIFCLSEWAVDYFINVFPQLKELTVPFYYGIDTNNFDLNLDKIKNKFIYSSYPNRGLLYLLYLWPKISEKYPDASLHIYCDLDSKWVNSVAGEDMKVIRSLLEKYDEMKNMNIFNHGWVSKKELAESWATSQYWFYPCTFMETFCLTALEAALSKTVIITNHLAALKNVVDDRGVIIEGDVTTTEWQNKALNELFFVMDNSKKRKMLAEKGYNWAKKMSWENRAQEFLQKFILN